MNDFNAEPFDTRLDKVLGVEFLWPKPSDPQSARPQFERSDRVTLTPKS